MHLMLHSEIWLHSSMLVLLQLWHHNEFVVFVLRDKKGILKATEAQWSPQTLNFDSTSGLFCVTLSRSPGFCGVSGGFYSVKISSSSHHNQLDLQHVQSFCVMFCWKF